MKKGFLVTVLTIAALTALTACGSGGSTGGSSTGESSPQSSAVSENSGEVKILTIQLGPNPESIDPALNSSGDGGN